ncbi:hypothetical protein ERJ75_000466900 [Trypanosoma vivax]|nr:hypothetical protein ERJ75_000466900 [Trypanosoma vivax]
MTAVRIAVPAARGTAADDEAQDEGTHEHADAGEDGASQEGAGITADAVRLCARREQLRGVGVSTATLWSRVNVSVARAAEHESTADGAAAAAVAANASRARAMAGARGPGAGEVVAGLMDEVAASSAPEDTRGRRGRASARLLTCRLTRWTKSGTRPRRCWERRVGLSDGESEWSSGGLRAGGCRGDG